MNLLTFRQKTPTNVHIAIFYFGHRAFHPVAKDRNSHRAGMRYNLTTVYIIRHWRFVCNRLIKCAFGYRVFSWHLIINQISWVPEQRHIASVNTLRNSEPKTDDSTWCPTLVWTCQVCKIKVSSRKEAETFGGLLGQHSREAVRVMHPRCLVTAVTLSKLGFMRTDGVSLHYFLFIWV